MAGINAARGLRGQAPWVPDRSEAYLGVLLDDLCGHEHREPYRMFTSRAEHRLVLGVDSARERLMAEGHRLGLVPAAAFHVEQARWRRRDVARRALESARLNPDRRTRAAVRAAAGVDIASPTTWARLLRRQDVDWQALAGRLPQLADLSPGDRRVVVGELRYDGYRQRHERERARVKRLTRRPLPPDLEPRVIPGLSREVVEALIRERPRSLAEAERLPGMTPAALAILAGWLSREGSGRG
jgi:tRNA uridine 5-carboxymethylaminomethyl modification enzyme